MMSDLFQLDQQDAFREDKAHISVIPVSVIDITAQKKRANENHATTSSRANYSPFPIEIVDLCYELYLRESSVIFDPFAGWGERHSGAKKHCKKYIGYDISPEAIEKARNEHGVINTLENSLTGTLPESFNGLITCPPYWNLEKYASPSGLDKLKTWPEFIGSLGEVFSRAYNAADAGATFCVMTGDWRAKHVYYDLTHQVDVIFSALGADIVDKVTVSRKKVSKIKIMLPQAKRLGYSVRVHESLHVFRKPL